MLQSSSSLGSKTLSNNRLFHGVTSDSRGSDSDGATLPTHSLDPTGRTMTARGIT